jgi:hypothetical protein
MLRDTQSSTSPRKGFSNLGTSATRITELDIESSDVVNVVVDKLVFKLMHNVLVAFEGLL